MYKRRIAWIIIIFCAAVLYMFDNGTVSLALLACCILVPAVSLVLLAAAGGNLQVQLKPVDASDHPKAGQAESGQPAAGAGEVVIVNRGRLPLGKVSVKARCRNLRTGRAELVEVSADADRREQRIPLEIEMAHAGRYEILLEEAYAADALGLAKRRIETGGTAGVTVYPEIFPIRVGLASSAAVMLESDRYANRRGGNDPGEVREIREYIPGDPVRNIHWKLSEKTDKLLVKELGMPVTDQLMVLLDTAASEPEATEPAALDTIASVYMSLLQALTESGYDFNVGWLDRSRQPVLRKITSPAHVVEAAESFLASPPDEGGLLRQIDSIRGENRFSHLVIAGAQIPAGIEEIAGGAQITLLLYGWDSAVRDGVSIIGFDTQNVRQELAGIEI